MRVDLLLSVALALAFWRFAYVAAKPRPRELEIDTEFMSTAWLGDRRRLQDVAPAARAATQEPGSLTIGLQPGTAIHLVKTPTRRAS